MIYISFKNFVTLIREGNTIVQGYNSETGENEGVCISDYRKNTEIVNKEQKNAKLVQ